MLIGQPPRAELELPAASLPTVEELPTTGLPAELLRRRPDVQAAQLRLAAADLRTAVAAAELLPALRLTGGAGYQSGQLHDLFRDGLWGIAAGLAAPLFEGGRLRAEVERAEAVVAERLSEYEQVVLLAFREVEDALVQEARQREFLTSLDEQVRLARSTLQEAQQRYAHGLNDYLPVLTALQDLQRLQRRRLAAHRELVSFRIRL
ncbi:unnamed protein product, partial [marine sediment metagenome]